jgi:hypothetical protein
MNALTVNIHLMLAAFYRPTPATARVLVEASQQFSFRDRGFRYSEPQGAPLCEDIQG